MGPFQSILQCEKNNCFLNQLSHLPIVLSVSDFTKKLNQRTPGHSRCKALLSNLEISFLKTFIHSPRISFDEDKHITCLTVLANRQEIFLPPVDPIHNNVGSFEI